MTGWTSGNKPDLLSCRRQSESYLLGACVKKGQKKYYHQIREDEVPTQNEPLAFEDGDDTLLFLTILHGPKAEYSFPNIKRKTVPKTAKGIIRSK